MKDTEKGNLVKRDYALYILLLVLVAFGAAFVGASVSSKSESKVNYYESGSENNASESEESVLSSVGGADEQTSSAEPPPDFPLDINSAEFEQLLYIDGIGEKTAQKIIDFRSERTITSIDMLIEIDGIGEKTIETLKKYLYVESGVYIPYVPDDSSAGGGTGEQTQSQPQAEEAVVIIEEEPPEDVPSVDEPTYSYVNINTADASEIASALLISYELAQEIVGLREQIGYFSSIDELELLDSFNKLDVAVICEYVIIE
ncbi:MAG: ComEA family DNA-binding protein [Oscillospiraceae bacterium]